MADFKCLLTFTRQKVSGVQVFVFLRGFLHIWESISFGEVFRLTLVAEIFGQATY
jgi:hypothetical protein